MCVSKILFLSESFHQNTIHLHSFITDDRWTGKLRKLIKNAHKIQITKHLGKKQVTNLKHSAEIKVTLFPKIADSFTSKNVLPSYFTASEQFFFKNAHIVQRKNEYFLNFAPLPPIS